MSVWGMIQESDRLYSSPKMGVMGVTVGVTVASRLHRSCCCSRILLLFCCYCCNTSTLFSPQCLGALGETHAHCGTAHARTQPRTGDTPGDVTLSFEQFELCSLTPVCTCPSPHTVSHTYSHTQRSSRGIRSSRLSRVGRGGSPRSSGLRSPS